MDTCFLFTEYLNDNGCLCLKLSAEGLLKTPPAQLSFNEIRELQKDSKTILVESCVHATLIDLNLPWLSNNKARAAIPYALEDKLAQPVEELHFAFDKARYQNNQYLVTVIAKQKLLDVMQRMDEHGISFETMTLDWFALDKQQLCISDNNLLVNQDDFKGVLSGTLALTYIKQHPLSPPLAFKNSIIEHPLIEEKSTEFSQTWIAQRLLKTTPLNLCQGEMEHNTSSDWIKTGYKLAGLCCGIWLISVLVVNALILFSLNKKTAEVDSQISVIYHQFFPEAKQVINPKFRISQLLKTNQNENQARFWFLMNEFSKTMKNSTISVQQLRYQNKTLSVTVVSPDFITLESLEKTLKAQLQVNQTEASTHEQQVIATLELT